MNKIPSHLNQKRSLLELDDVINEIIDRNLDFEKNLLKIIENSKKESDDDK